MKSKMSEKMPSYLFLPTILMSGSVTLSSSSLTKLPDAGAAPAVTNHIARSVGCNVQQRIDALGVGQKMQDLPENLWHKSFRFYVKEDPTRRGGPNLRLIRLDPAKPSLTVTAYVFNKFVHPFEDRFITVREAARLQGFPDTLQFQGTLTSTQLQVGNAVPVPLARSVFQSILSHARTCGLPERPLTGMSLFSGAGGMDIGAEQAAFGDLRIDTKTSIECLPDACRTLQGYYQERLEVIPADIAEITDPLSYWFCRSGEVQRPDVVFGGPPCQAFSQAGKQKGLDDERGGMMSHFLRFVQQLEPAFFVMENVANFKGIGGGKLYESVLKQMYNLGYDVTVCTLLAADYGAPQRRQRLFFIGSRFGQVQSPAPTHSRENRLFHTEPYLTVGEAFAGLPPAVFTTVRTRAVLQ